MGGAHYIFTATVMMHACGLYCCAYIIYHTPGLAIHTKRYRLQALNFEALIDI